MMYLVCYHDDYCDAGGVGWEEFPTEEEALRFIEDRLRDKKEATLGDYVLYWAQRLPLVAVETATRVMIDRS